MRLPGQKRPAQARPRGSGNLSIASSNHLLTAIKGFCRWMVRDGRTGDSPVAYLQTLNAATDVRHQRRALSRDEVRRLVRAARMGPTRYGMRGPERALVYRLAVETGLRLGELRSLTPASFDLDTVRPTMTVEAAYSKDRREDVLPLKPETAADLRRFLEGKAPGEAAWPPAGRRAFSLPKWWKPVKMLREDLEAAAGFEPANGGFAIRCLDPLGYAARLTSPSRTAGTPCRGQRF